MPIETIERYHCGRCDYITTNQTTIAIIRVTDICPACQNGKHTKWSSKCKSRYLIESDKASKAVQNILAKIASKNVAPYSNSKFIKE